MDLPLYLQIIGFVILGAVSFTYLWSSVRRVKQTEVTELMETRGKHIADLESEVATLQEKVAALQECVIQLEQAAKAYQGIKADEIAVEVARLLAPIIESRG